MEKEIKEILFLLHNDRLTESGKRKLEDYITNLQEELQYQQEAELEYNEKHIKLMQKYAEVQENYERIYNENCILRERIEYLERSNNRREDEILSLRQELYGQGSE